MWSSTTWSPTGTQCVPRRGPAPAPAIASTAVPTNRNGGRYSRDYAAHRRVQRRRDRVAGAGRLPGLVRHRGRRPRRSAPRRGLGHPEVGKVTVRATPASAVQTLPFHAVPVRACGSPAPGWPTSAPVPARSPSTTGPVRSSRRTRRGRAGNSAEPSGADAVGRTGDPCRGAGPGTRPPANAVGRASRPGFARSSAPGWHRRCRLGGERGLSARIRGRR